jgi:hypothetical protein
MAVAGCAASRTAGFPLEVAMSASGHPPTLSSPRRVIVASLIGTSLEWYDFFLYGSAAALVFANCSFRSSIR